MTDIIADAGIEAAIKVRDIAVAPVEAGTA
jgi:hypothetical protein